MIDERKEKPEPFPGETGGVLSGCESQRVPARRSDTWRTSRRDDAAALIAQRFRVLGEPLRLRLIQLLQRGEKSVSELAEESGVSQSNVSRHLQVIESAGIVARRRRGNLIYYFIADESVLPLCDAVCRSIGQRLSREARLGAELGRTIRHR